MGLHVICIMVMYLMCWHFNQLIYMRADIANQRELVTTTQLTHVFLTHVNYGIQKNKLPPKLCILIFPFLNVLYSSGRHSWSSVPGVHGEITNLLSSISALFFFYLGYLVISGTRLTLGLRINGTCWERELKNHTDVLCCFADSINFYDSYVWPTKPHGRN